MTSPTLATAEQVHRVLDAHGTQVALIGGTALAVHGYTRQTQDLDFVTACDLAQLHALATALRVDGFAVEAHDPGPPGEDDLDGTLKVCRGDEPPVHVVNMRSGLGRSALATALTVPGLPFRVVDLAHLVALKLKANGFRDRSDVAELLVRNPAADRAAILATCARFKLSKRFERVVRELAAPPEPEDE